MASTKAKGSTKLGRGSEAKRLGVKIADGQIAKVGEIIIRQRGTHYIPGLNVKRAEDDTLYAMKTGRVNFITKKKNKFDGSWRMAKVVSVKPEATQ